MDRAAALRKLFYSSLLPPPSLTPQLPLSSSQTDDAERHRGQQQGYVLTLIRDMCDLPIPMHALDLLPTVPSGLVGLSGTIASLIGMYEVWIKQNAKSQASRR